MAAPDPDAEQDVLFERMLAAGHAEFSLSAASYDVVVASVRERQLVDTAVAAGVVGALSVLRDDGD